MKRSYYRLDIISLVVVFIFNIQSYCQPLKCPLHENCLNQIQDSTDLSVTSNSLLPKPNQSLSYSSSSLYECSCDSTSCHIYGDCCLDVQLNRASLLFTTYSCISINTIKGDLINGNSRHFISSLSFQSVSKCSKLWSVDSNVKHNSFNANEIKSDCEKANNGRDLMLTVPLTSNKTGITYKNIYCAVCNFDIETSKAWKANTFCSRTSPESCLITFEEPLSPPIRHCYPPNLIDFCLDNSSTFQQKLNCSLYSAPIKGFKGYKGYEPVLFKNHYCAQCNREIAKGFNCPDFRHRSTTTLDSSYSFSFSIVLDINFKGKVGTKQRCEANHIYDPWKKSCRRVYCRENTVFVDGECLHSNGGKNYTNLFDICPKIVLEPEEYKQLSDGTVSIIANNKIYNNSEYKIDTSTNILTICSYPSENERSDDDLHTYLTIGCLTISIISLAIKISYFFLKPEPKRISSILVLFLSISLILAQLLFLFGINRIEIHVICQIIAILMHYFFLASFFWMNVLSYDIYRTFASMLMPKSSNLFSRQLFLYSIYGWTLPLIITSSAIVVDYRIVDNDISPNYGAKYCWFANRLALTVFLAAPLAILLIINTALLILTAIKINNVSESTRFARENINQRKERFRFILYIKLATIMGSTWIIGFMAAYADVPIIWILFIVLNSLQGLYILLAFTHWRSSDLSYCCQSGIYRRTSNKSLSTSVTNTKV